MRDNGVNMGVVGQNCKQEGVDVMDTDSWVTVDLGISTDRRQAKYLTIKLPTMMVFLMELDGGGCHWAAAGCWCTPRIRAASKGSSGVNLFDCWIESSRIDEGWPKCLPNLLRLCECPISHGPQSSA